MIGRAKDEQEEEHRLSEAESKSTSAAKISTALVELTGELLAFKKELQTKNEADQRQRREYETDELFWTRIAAIAAIAFSVLSLILSGLTLYVLSRQATIMNGQKEITEKTLPAMQQQAQAAVMQAETAKDTLRLVESPDVELESIECSTPAFGLDTRLTLHYRNFGRTKAEGVRSVFSCSVRDAKDHSPLPPPTLTGASVGAVAPNAIYPSGTTATVGELLAIRFPTVAPVESLQRLRNGELVFEFWGVNDYQSMVGDHMQNTFNYVWDRAWPDKCIFTLIGSH